MIEHYISWEITCTSYTDCNLFIDLRYYDFVTGAPAYGILVCESVKTCQRINSKP